MGLWKHVGRMTIHEQIITVVMYVILKRDIADDNEDVGE